MSGEWREGTASSQAQKKVLDLLVPAPLVCGPPVVGGRGQEEDFFEGRWFCCLSLSPTSVMVKELSLPPFFQIVRWGVGVPPSHPLYSDKLAVGNGSFQLRREAPSSDFSSAVYNKPPPPASTETKTREHRPFPPSFLGTLLPVGDLSIIDFGTLSHILRNLFSSMSVSLGSNASEKRFGSNGGKNMYGSGFYDSPRGRKEKSSRVAGSHFSLSLSFPSITLFSSPLRFFRCPGCMALETFAQQTEIVLKQKSVFFFKKSHVCT